MLLAARSHFVSACTLASLSVLPACAGEEESSAFSETALAENPVQGVLRAICERGARCLPHSGLEDLLLRAPYGGDIELCVAVLSYAVAPVEAAYLRALERGELQVDVDDLSACLQRLTRCEPLQPDDLGSSVDLTIAGASVESCPRWAGTLGSGERCQLAGSCAQGLFCDRSERSCPGTCRPQVTAGQSCVVDAQCADGDPHRIAECVRGECVTLDIEIAPIADRGRACGEVDAGTARRFTFCEPESYCRCSDEIADGGFFGALQCGNRGTCAAPVRRGQPCRRLLDVCEEGSVCSEDVCVAASDVFLLAPVDGRRRVDPDQLFSLERGAPCLPPALFDESDDETMLASSELRFCSRNLFCELASGTCQPVKAGGSECDDDLECISGECERGVCAELFCSDSGF